MVVASAKPRPVTTSPPFSATDGKFPPGKDLTRAKTTEVAKDAIAPLTAEKTPASFRDQLWIVIANPSDATELENTLLKITFIRYVVFAIGRPLMMVEQYVVDIFYLERTVALISAEPIPILEDPSKARGLPNFMLGMSNVCFMNTALQSLARTGVLNEHLHAALSNRATKNKELAKALYNILYTLNKEDATAREVGRHSSAFYRQLNRSEAWRRIDHVGAGAQQAYSELFAIIVTEISPFNPETDYIVPTPVYCSATIPRFISTKQADGSWDVREVAVDDRAIGVKVTICEHTPTISACIANFSTAEPHTNYWNEERSEFRGVDRKDTFLFHAKRAGLSSVNIEKIQIAREWQFSASETESGTYYGNRLLQFFRRPYADLEREYCKSLSPGNIQEFTTHAELRFNPESDVVTFEIQNPQAEFAVEEVITLDVDGEPVEFQLCGTANRSSGAGASSRNGGHWTSSAKVGDQWIEFNDSKVTEREGPKTTFIKAVFYKRVEA
ncbi:hypothetical protein K0U07_00745 [bacterium]|nr:hypothetical protein [bacterium]